MLSNSFKNFGFATKQVVRSLSHNSTSARKPLLNQRFSQMSFINKKSLNKPAGVAQSYHDQMHQMWA